MTLARIDQELAEIAAYETGPDTGEQALLGALWRCDWEAERWLLLTEERAVRA